MESAASEPGLELKALESALRWYLAMGVDSAIDEAPHDRFAQGPASLDPSPPAAVEPARPEAQQPLATADHRAASAVSRTPPAGAEALIAEATAIAANAHTIEALRAAWGSFQGCALASTASGMIFASGTPRARLMIIGAAPGSDDERQGEAFAGPAGRLVDGMLAAIGLSRETAYLANVIPWRPPGNRPPTPIEAALCLPFTRRHIALADPAVILCLGERAAQLLLDSKETLSKLRGRWLSFEGQTKTVKLAVTFSPDYLLSQPLQKKRAWLDLIAVSKMLGSFENAGETPRKDHDRR